MDTVGIRDLKAHLSRHLKRVRAGARLAVTERGRTIATINPVDARHDLDWAHQMVADGRAQWNGRKPQAALPRMRPLKGHRASTIVLEDRR